MVQNNSGFDANAKLLNFTEKLKTPSGKYKVNMVMWPFLSFFGQFLVNVVLNLSIKFSATRFIDHRPVSSFGRAPDC